METNSKEHCLREVRKLIEIMNTWGNPLVPTLEGQSETTAQERLFHFLGILKDEHEIVTEEQIYEGINALD